MDKPKQTLVEEGTELKGTLKSSCQVVINGAIDGQIEAPALTVTKTGSVHGSVKAKKLRSDGTVAGDIDAEDVYLSGTVRDNTVIRAKSLEVKLSPDRGKLQLTFGETLLEVGDDPAHQEDVPASSKKSEDAEAAPAREAPAAPRAGVSEIPSWSEPPSKSERDSEGPDSEEEAASAGEPAQATDESSDSNGQAKNTDENRPSQAPPA